LCLPSSIVDDVNVETFVEEVRNVLEKAHEQHLIKHDDKVKDKIKKAEAALKDLEFYKACANAEKAWHIAFDRHDHHDDDDDHNGRY